MSERPERDEAWYPLQWQCVRHGTSVAVPHGRLSLRDFVSFVGEMLVYLWSVSASVSLALRSSDVLVWLRTTNSFILLWCIMWLAGDALIRGIVNL